MTALTSPSAETVATQPALPAHKPGMDTAFPVLVIDEPTQYVYRGYETASAYDVHTLHPGIYEPRPYRHGHPCPPGIAPDRVIFQPVSTLELAHRVNRAFAASSVSREEPKTTTTIALSFYPHELLSESDFRGPGRLVHRRTP